MKGNEDQSIAKKCNNKGWVGSEVRRVLEALE